MTREQMVAEFGEPGVQNSALMDLITEDPTSGDVLLVMIERRPWNIGGQQFGQIEEKINRYLAYALDGWLVQHHPRYLGRRVVLRLDCAETPHGDAIRFLEAATHAIREHGLDLLVNVTGNGPPPSS